MTPAVALFSLLGATPLAWMTRRLAVFLTGTQVAPPRLAWMAIAALAMIASSLALAAPAAGWILGVALLILIDADLIAFRLPDAITLPLILAGLVVAGVSGAPPWPDLRSGPLVSHLIGAGAGYAALAAVAAGYRRLRGRDGLGLGDAKLAAAGGAWLGWTALPLMILIACGLAFIWIGLRLARHGRAVLSQASPFGPPLAVAIWILWLVPGLIA